MVERPGRIVEEIESRLVAGHPRRTEARAPNGGVTIAGMPAPTRIVDVEEGTTALPVGIDVRREVARPKEPNPPARPRNLIYEKKFDSTNS